MLGRLCALGLGRYGNGGGWTWPFLVDARVDLGLGLLVRRLCGFLSC